MRAVALAVALALCSAACGDDGGGRSAAKPANESSVAAGKTYDQSTEGLQQMLGDLIDAVRANNREEIARLTGDLALDDPKAWFTRTFGQERGALLLAEYEPVVGQFEQLADLLVGLVKAGQTDIRAEVFERAGDSGATGYQNLALAAMKQATPLYSARFTKVEDASGFHLWSFVYDGGRFRWVGKMKAVAPTSPADPDLLELRERLARQAGTE